ncbi:hypothetical protein [Pseudonocardia lacus]|uniref:hypothetical protein n=1 Tax=Pseudonocardia lacus TaxID=2835865 RepID=UPI001BDDA03F|nr:hypothetical protein [Pseudonocardia lacus]
MIVDPVGGTAPAVAVSFLDTLGAREFARLSSCLGDDVRMRALLPSGVCDSQGAAAVTDRFRSWFADAAEFQLVDSGVDRIGPLLSLRWRLRVRFSPRSPRLHVVEQLAYVHAPDRIRRLDLLCSGFHGDGHG